MKELIVDGSRIDSHGSTGIYVRAKYDGKWGSYDIATLTLSSLHAWLRSRSGENEWAENAVATLLGHVTDGSDGARCQHENIDHLFPGDVSSAGYALPIFRALGEQLRCLDCGAFLPLGPAAITAEVAIEIAAAQCVADDFAPWPVAIGIEAYLTDSDPPTKEGLDPSPWHAGWLVGVMKEEP